MRTLPTARKGIVSLFEDKFHHGDTTTLSYTAIIFLTPRSDATNEMKFFFCGLNYCLTRILYLFQELIFPPALFLLPACAAGE